MRIALLLMQGADAYSPCLKGEEIPFSQRLTEKILDMFVDQKESKVKPDLG